MITGGRNQEVTICVEPECRRAEARRCCSKVEDVCGEHGISSATYYNWKLKYGGVEALIFVA